MAERKWFLAGLWPPPEGPQHPTFSPPVEPIHLRQSRKYQIRGPTVEDEPEQDALFEIEGPDEDGCVWISSMTPGGWSQNLGPRDKVAEVLSQWLGSIDYEGE